MDGVTSRVVKKYSLTFKRTNLFITEIKTADVGGELMLHIEWIVADRSIIRFHARDNQTVNITVLSTGMAV